MPSYPLAEYRNIVILTGAGISVASGLSTYRGPGGLWTKLDVERIAHASNLPGTLPELWELYKMRRMQALSAIPNAAHLAIVTLQRLAPERGQTVTLVTQNVDGLHRRAGSEDVIELHGSAFRTKCFRKKCTLKPFADTQVYDEAPRCPVCGNYLRPDVVLFGESLSEETLTRAVEPLLECDLFLSVGTSGVVWPAAQLVSVAKQRGAHTISVNIEASGNPAFDTEQLGPAEEVLPALLVGKFPD